MRNILALVFFLVSAPALAATTVDTFSGTAGTDLASHTPDSGGPWTQEGAANGLQLGGSGTLGLAGVNASQYTVPVGSNDQYAQITISTSLQASNRFLMILRASDANNYYYLSKNGTTSWTLGKRLVGNASTITTYTVATTGAGDVVKFTAVGTTLSMYLNGALVNSSTDSDLATGDAGLRTGTSSVFADQISRFEAGAIGGGTVVAQKLSTLGVGN